jgi:hypothetical protein
MSKLYINPILKLHYIYILCVVSQTQVLDFYKTTLIHLNSTSHSHPFNTKGPLLIYNYLNNPFSLAFKFLNIFLPHFAHNFVLKFKV